MQVIILSGIPGSGKSHFAMESKISAVSADDYLPANPKPTDFSIAHAKCFKEYLFFLKSKHLESLIVDNTNLNSWEISPYALAASSFQDVSVVIRRIHCDAELAWKRQTHNVPFDTFCQMVANFKKRDVLPWWTVYEQHPSPVK